MMKKATDLSFLKLNYIFRERSQYQLSPVEIHFLDAFEAEQKRLHPKK